MELRDGLRHNLAGLGHQPLYESETEAVAELTSYDNHPADLATETFEREKDVGLVGDARELLARAEAALKRLAEGEYGRCQVCGRPIARERLAAQPWVELCFGCQKAREAQRRYTRPVEEEVLDWRRAYTGREDEAGFDAEDTWQALARLGSSDTRADRVGALGGAARHRDLARALAKGKASEPVAEDDQGAATADGREAT
jgi:YteA family regulatory protein